MGSNSSSNVKWFVIALVVIMAVCLVCAVTTLLVIRWGVTQVEQAELYDYVPEESEPTRTPLISPSEEPENIDLSHLTLEKLASTIVPINEPIELAERLRGLKDVPRILAEEAEPIQVGTVDTFWVSNVDTIENFEVQAEMVYATDHVYFWVEKGVDFDPDDAQALVDDFEEGAYPTNRSFFGSEWSPGVDGDVHLYILYATNLGYSVAGYFSSADELSPLAHQYSNGHEMFYLSADNVELWEEFTYSVLAHEFQHMIHWSLDRNEESWLNEGFSELASHLNGFDVGGWDYAYASEPDLALTYWPTSGGAHYGQAFLFVTYFLDRFGSEATQAVVANPKNGLDSIDRTLEAMGIVDNQTDAPITADEVHRDWAIAMLVNDPSISEGRYTFHSYVAPQVSYSDQFVTCPTGPQERQVNQYGIDYIQIECEGTYSLSFDGASVVPVLPGEAYSGDFTFWSNRGDESDMTLTRSFDLRQVDGPVEASYWVWYDIEEGWDYLYLEVSLDGGDTWQILETPSGTAEDLSGNSFGWAYTGYSGGGEEPRWIQETVDLSDFTGQEILLRFEYITDAAVNGDGLLIDDLSIEAIDYFEDFETDEGGWQAAGFVRLYNRLPQTYRVVLVEQGREIEVRELTLDEANHAEIEITFDEGTPEAVLIVTATTRHSWQPAAYIVELK
ncbi:MAG: immune inhibitor A [Anaerolineales bacterium]|nr:immune inhibitor A [Anaerolineales bacterium]